MAKGIIAFFTLVFLPSAFAGYGGGYFDNLRNDQTIPEHCQHVDLSRFDMNNLEFFTVSIEGGVNKGFTYEYPMRRNDARKLWDIGQSLDGGADPDDLRGRLRNQEMRRDFDVMSEDYAARDIHFDSEGEVLEIVALRMLQEDLSDDFYVFGAVNYGKNRVMGELDLIIARKADCKIFSIGEAKLGIGSLSKAKSQLNRFRSFLYDHVQDFMNVLDVRSYL